MRSGEKDERKGRRREREKKRRGGRVKETNRGRQCSESSNGGGVEIMLFILRC